MKKWYNTHKKKSKVQGSLTWARLKTTNGWPKIKCKAAATRHLAAFALDLAVRYCQHDERIIAVAQLMNEFYVTLESEKVFLRDHAITRLGQIGQDFCDIYAELSNCAYDNDIKMWKMTPELHMFIHLCQWDIVNSKLNPRVYWTYADEDLVGTLCEVAESCHPSTMPFVSLSKWAILEFA